MRQYAVWNIELYWIHLSFFFIIVHVCATYMKISLRDDPIQMYVGG